MAEDITNRFAAIGTSFVSIPLAMLAQNDGQIEGLPANPRNWTDDKLDKLKRDLQQYPEMLNLRGLLVYAHAGGYVTVGGNMRLHAMRELGFSEAPCIVIPQDTDVERLRAYTILDNSGFGKWDFTMLADDWDKAQLTEWGVDLPIMESDINPDDFFEAYDGTEEVRPDKIVITLEGELRQQKEQIKTLIVDALSDYDNIKIK